jgi:prepilin-type N-terminal cleavage/methylation domain-containing protein
MKINKTKTFSSAFTLPKQRERVSAFTLIELLVVIAIIAILASIALPAFTAVQERGKQTKDMSNGKQIALALKQFSTDHNGVFPNKKPGDVTSSNYDAGAIALDAGANSNDAFWWLFPNYLTSEDIFSVAGSAWCPNPPDNKLDPSDAITRTDTLKATECGYAYVTALTDTANPQFPLIADGGTELAQGPTTYTNVQSAKGGVWKGKKAIIIFVDGSGSAMTCNDQTNATASFVTRPGHAYNVTDNTQVNANDPWLSATNLILPPL